jgi:APA family basic amino acid/polyamine antiporter
MARRRLHGLQRVLGVNALSATAYGNVGSSIYYALGLVASYALGLTPVVFVIAGVIFFFTAATYAEATAMYPEAGGSSSFARHAFNEFWSFVAAWGQMLNYVVTIAISAFFLPHYVGGVFWEPLRHSPGDVLFAIGVIILLSAVNVAGVRESTGLNVVLAVIDFCTQVLLVLVGAALVLSPETLVNNVDFGVAPTWKDFLIAIPVGMIAYTGIETISNMAEEARDQERTIPAAINRVVIAVFAIYGTLPAVALSALPVVQAGPGDRIEGVDEGDHYTPLGLTEDQGGVAGNPVLGVVETIDLGPLQAPAEVYVGMVAAIILFVASNAAIIGVSRLVYSMGLHRQVPDRLRQLHPRYGTPWLGIVLFGALACVTVIPGEAQFLANIYAFGAMLSFTVAHLAVVRMRMRDPDRRRPYRGPGELRIAGRRLPLFAIVGGLGTGLAFVVVTALHLDVAVAGLGWLIVGVLIFVVYRRQQGLDLVTTTRIAIERPVVDREAEYESVLVALDHKSYAPEAIATAAKLAAPRRRGIHVLVTIPVPTASPVDAALPEQEVAAQAVIEQAKLQAGRRVSGHWEKTRPGQAGRVIVQEAREMRAQAIVMPMPPRGGGTPFGKTLETVLTERPCRVIIEAGPRTREPPPPPAEPVELLR